MIYNDTKMNQELIQDLENKLRKIKTVLVETAEYATTEYVDRLKFEINLLESVLGRVVAQQELSELKSKYLLKSVYLN